MWNVFIYTHTNTQRYTHTYTHTHTHTHIYTHTHTHTYTHILQVLWFLYFSTTIAPVVFQRVVFAVLFLVAGRALTMCYATKIRYSVLWAYCISYLSCPIAITVRVCVFSVEICFCVCCYCLRCVCVYSVCFIMMCMYVCMYTCVFFTMKEWKDFCCHYYYVMGIVNMIK